MQSQTTEAATSGVKQPGRNIVLCLDGTGDWAGTGYTNVAKIFQALDREKQLCFYDGGVGTLSPPQALNPVKRTLLRLLDLGVATSLREKTLSAYTFLVRNYQPETETREADRIFLFGFSRGAFTARLVASMIHNFGLLRPECEHLAPYLWQTIAELKLISTFKKEARRIRVRFSLEPIKIHFMGLFDTVSSVGVIGRFRTYPNTAFNPDVARVCHAVAIDEQRNVFPETLMHPRQRGLIEVWFPGVHRDSGGGLQPGKSRISDEALVWIETEAVKSGLTLRMHKVIVDLEPKPNYPSYDPYVAAGLYPMKMFSKRVSGFRVFWPNFRHTRIVPHYSLVHDIFFKLKEVDSKYQPINVPENVQRFNTGDVGKGPEHYILTPARINVSDFVGITLGTAWLFLIWNSLVGSPLTPFPPNEFLGWHISTWLWVLFGIFLGCQALGQKLTDALPPRYRPRSEGILPYVFAVAGVFLLKEFHHWPAIWWALAGGLILFAVAQVPPLPVLRTDRVLPSVLGVTIASSFVFAALPHLKRFGVKLDLIISVTVLLMCASVAVVLLIIDRFKMASIEDESKKAARIQETK